MTPPTVAGWNLALRFILELTALAELGFAAWKLSPRPLRWATMAAGAIAATGHRRLAMLMSVLVAVHYSASWTLIEWLIQA